jgi:(5-formylfuran-3-yl)methyl phosphate synthase
VWTEVLELIAGRAVVTAALGELLSSDMIRVAQNTRGIRYVKIGLAGCNQKSGWIARWCNVIAALPSASAAVPVAYADWPAANAPSPSVALALAAHSRARLLLIDTFEKNGRTLLDHLPLESVRELAETARESQVSLVLAGSLDEAAIRNLLQLSSAYVGVRGAVCRGGRDQALDVSLVKSLAAVVHAHGRKAAG